MSKPIIGCALLALCACGNKNTAKDNVASPGNREPAAAPTPAVDHSDPKKVVEAMFAAAASGKDDVLASLCDPGGSGDGDSKEICALKLGAPKWAEFATYFGKATVTGGPTYEDDRALVDIRFGPNGDKTENIGLIKIDGKWYLARF